MKLFKNYVSKQELRNRLDIQMDNNKMINNQNIFLAKETIKYQNEIKDYRLEIARLIVLTEDLTGFREQDQECIKALKKERQSLKTKLTKLEKKNETKVLELDKDRYFDEVNITSTDISVDGIATFKEKPTVVKRGKKDGK